MKKPAKDAVAILKQSQETGNKAVIWSHEAAALLAHIERLEQQLADSSTTHFDGCHDRGPKHYGCALRRIERLESPQIPEGCVVVPREPTRGMLDIMEAVDEDGYREMYVAAINHYENHRHE